MEFKKKYLFMVPFTLMFFVLSVSTIVNINEYTIKGLLGDNFPLLLAVGFWVLEFIKYDEVNKDAETSGARKRLLPSDTNVIPFVIVFMIYFIVPTITLVIDEAFGFNQAFFLASMVFAIIPFCVFLTLNLLKLDFEFVKNNIYKYISYILLFSVALFGLNILLNIIYYIFDLQMMSANEESINDTLNTLPTFSKALFIIYLVIGAPILEELLFRGFPFQPNVKKRINYVIAIAISLVFAFFHYIASFDPDLLKFTDPISVLWPYFMMSMVFSVSYIESDYNLLVPIGIHALNNFSALVLY